MSFGCPSSAAQVDGVIADVRKGRRLSEALETRDFLPKHVVQMLRVGEESGRLRRLARAASPCSTNRGSIRRLRESSPSSVRRRCCSSRVLIAWLIISVMTALMSVNDLLK